MDNEGKKSGKQINLLGKDYLSEKEAAHYACLGLTTFRQQAPKYGIFPSRSLGTTKKIYRKSDIQRVIEEEFRKQHLILRSRY